MIALELCLQVPFTRIASLTLIVTHAGGWGGIAPFVGVRRMAKSIFTTDKKRKLDTLMRLLYSEETLKDSELANKLRGHHESRLATAIPPKLPAIVGHTLAVYRHFVSYPNLLRIRYAPFTTLIVVGSEDQLVRRSNSFMLGRVLGARVYEVQHGGHGLLAQYPDQINEEMMKHFKGKNAGKPMEGNSSSPDEDDESGNYTVESQEALMDCDDESSSNEDTSPRPYTLEEHALSLFCKHSVHCSIHNLSGFLTGFIPGFIFRWIFYDSIALSSPTHPVSRLDQSVRFGLLVGVVRSSIRALRCIWHAHRARQWIKKHSLRQTETPRNNNPSELRKGIPPGRFNREHVLSTYSFLSVLLADKQTRLSTLERTFNLLLLMLLLLLCLLFRCRFQLSFPFHPPPLRFCLRHLATAFAGWNLLSQPSHSAHPYSSYILRTFLLI